MWKVLHRGCLFSIPVSGFETDASPLGWADMHQSQHQSCEYAPQAWSDNTQQWEGCGAPKLLLFHTLCLLLQHCPPQSTERFLKLALQNRKCRFPHVWTRWLVHNEDTEGLDLVCISLNNPLWCILNYPPARDLARSWEHGAVGSGLK